MAGNRQGVLRFPAKQSTFERLRNEPDAWPSPAHLLLGAGPKDAAVFTPHPSNPGRGER